MLLQCSFLCIDINLFNRYMLAIVNKITNLHVLNVIICMSKNTSNRPPNRGAITLPPV